MASLKKHVRISFWKGKKILSDNGILDASENADMGDFFEFQLYQSKRIFGLDFIREA